MSKTWVAKTSADSAPTIKSVLDPIFEQHGFQITDRESQDRNHTVQRLAFQTAINALATTQPYYVEGMTIPDPVSTMVDLRQEAFNVLKKEKDRSKAGDDVEDFTRDVAAACESLVAHYRPKGGHAISGGDGRSKITRLPAGDE